jgi:hypothetical protein
VSRLGGEAVLQGNCFPQLGPQLFVITGEAASAENDKSRSSFADCDFEIPVTEISNRIFTGRAWV